MSLKTHSGPHFFLQIDLCRNRKIQMLYGGDISKLLEYHMFALERYNYLEKNPIRMYFRTISERCQS
jgi:hypothetical protein